MGFYQSSSERKRRIPGWIGVSVLSALVGCGTTLAVFPYLENHEVVSTTTGSSNAGVTSTNMSAPVTNVNVSINDAITQVVKKAIPSVVAVVNYQSTPDFFDQQSQFGGNWCRYWRPVCERQQLRVRGDQQSRRRGSPET